MDESQPATMPLNPIQPRSPNQKLTDYEAQAILSNARWEIGQNKKAKGCLQAWMSLCLGTPLPKPPPRGPDGRAQAIDIVSVEVRRARMRPSPLAGRRPPAPPESTARFKVEGRGRTHPLVAALLRPRPPPPSYAYVHPWQPLPAAAPRTTQPAPASTTPAPPSAASANAPATTTTPAPPAPATNAPRAAHGRTRAPRQPRPTALVQADESGVTLLRELLWKCLLEACGLSVYEDDMPTLISTVAAERPTERPIKVRRYNAPHFHNARVRVYAYAKPQLSRAQAAAKAAADAAAAEAAAAEAAAAEAAAAAAGGQAPPGVASAPAGASAEAGPPLPHNTPQKRARDEEGDAAEAPAAKRAATNESKQALETRNDGPTASTSSVPIGRDVQSANIIVPTQGSHVAAGEQTADRPQPSGDDRMDCDPPVDHDKNDVGAN